MITADQLTTIMPHANPSWVDPLNAAMDQFAITTPLRVAAFLAEIAVESGELMRLTENLNYSDVGHMKTFPREFPTQVLAAQYAHNPQRIADRVYANRLGNGDEASMDGWTYRGRGLIQITGKDNYRECGAALGDVSLLLCPDRLCTKQGAAQSAAWFFSKHGCNELADAGNIDAVSRRINGGDEGLVQRRGYYVTALKVLNG